MSKEAIVTDWGTDFLQSAQTRSVDMANQEDRWRAFHLLANTDPVSASRSEGTSIARQSVVLVDRAGTRFVRCGWFLSYVRATVGPYSPGDLARDMETVGWRRTGKGRIKATPQSTTTEPLVWTFYTVSEDWGTDA